MSTDTALALGLVVSGLALGLTAAAYTPARGALEQASDLFRSFREQPTPELARFARLSLVQTLSPNDRLQRTWSGWTNYLIVPLFGLANAGITIDAGFLGRALVSPVTLGVLLAYVVGKPVAVPGVAALITWLSRGRVRPAVGWASVPGTGSIAGIGFTVSFLVADLAFAGDDLAEAKLGVLLAAVVASVLTWAVFRVTRTLPEPRRAVALLGDADLRYVWRHLPLPDVHPQAQMAAQAAEAAGLQGRFWQMHDRLLDRQQHLRIADLIGYAGERGLDQDRFHADLSGPACTDRITADVGSADLSGVSGTPTFFINGRRHYGAYDVATLQAAIRVARARAKIAARR